MGTSSVRPPSAEVVPRLSIRDPDAWLSWVAWLVIALCAIQILTFSFGRDQSIYALVGDGVLHGKMPYRDLWDFKPPGIFLVYALAQGLFGRGMVAIRLLEVLGMIGSVFGFMRLAETFFERRQAGLVGGAVAALIQAELEFWHTAQPEVFGGYLTLAALLVATSAPHPRRRIWTWVITGVLFGLAFLFKPPLGGGAFVCGAYLAKREQQRTDSTPRALLTMVVVGASAALPILLCAAWFGLRGAWPALRWTLAEFTPGYTALGWQDRQAAGMLYYALEEAFFKFSALAAAGVIAMAAITPLHSREREGTYLVLGIIAIQIAGVAMQGKFFPYHYTATLQLIAFLAGLGLYKLWRRCMGGGFGGALAFMSFVAVVTSMRTASRDLPQDYSERALMRLGYAFRMGPYKTRDAIDRDLSYVADFNLAADRDVALEVRSRTRSEDPIFVWGFEPAIYWFSERTPSSRFIYDVPQRSEWQKGYARRELLRDLHSRVPALVIVQHNDVFPSVTGHVLDSHDELPGFPELAGFIENGYQFVKRIEDFDIYERKPS
ncbi:MAG TPA: glycosyltransferase family 39 protein [Polyangiaceae bacterium]|nr:glycosyltransferase family 39 protein [Polyangiaceae bacterium]